ncbi:MAG: PilZ domain-containing protein [Acidobacteriota bacterium]
MAPAATPPKNSFYLKLEIFRSCYQDFDLFIHTLAQGLNWEILGFDISRNAYAFKSQWFACLDASTSNILLQSPLLTEEHAPQLKQVLRTLSLLDVRVGQNCQPEITEGAPRKRWLVRIFKRVPVEFYWGLGLVLFLVMKTVELELQPVLSRGGLLLLQSAGYAFFMFFAVSLYKGFSANKRKTDSATEKDLRASLFEELEAKPGPEDAEIVPSTPEERAEILQVAELAREIKDPVENIMAYARFYKATARKSSQQWKDLLELMEQAIRLQEIVNRSEGTARSRGLEEKDIASSETETLFRRTPRTTRLVPVTVRGVDPLGDPFENSCYTLNISPRGACLLLPDKAFQPGQILSIQNHVFESDGEVRWIIGGQEGGLVFAGVRFCKPVNVPLEAMAS